MKRLLFLLSLLVVMGITKLFAQRDVKDVIRWETAVQRTGQGIFNVTLSATIIDGWHIFTAIPGGDGMFIPTSVSFSKNKRIRFIGKTIIQGKVQTKEIKDLDYSINYYERRVSFSRRLAASANTTLEVSVEYQVCNDEKCMPAVTERFVLPISAL